MTSNSISDLDIYNYKKLAQFEAVISVDLSYEPKSFENLLNLHQNFDINYRIPETCFIKSNRSHMIGTTLLDMTMDMLQSDMFKILIRRGADFTNVNDNACTVIHDSIGDNFGKLLKTRKSKGYFEDNGFAKIALDAQIDYNISKNPSNSYEFSHFHIACMMNHTKAVEYFLKNKTLVNEATDKDSPELPGFTALHFAVKYSSYETAELLLNYGADINLKDERGLSAFHVLLDERLKTWPAAFRYAIKPDSTWVKNSFKKYFNNNEKILKLFMERNSTNVSTDDLGFSYLQAACTLQDSSLIKQTLSESSVNLNHPVKLDSPIWPGYTALHFAAHFNSEIFKFLLEKGADIGIRDAHATTPFDICMPSFKVEDIHSILSHHPYWKNILFSDGKTKLLDFILAMQDAGDFSSFLDDNVTNINMFVPLDSPICSGYTPLHLAVILSKKPPNYNESDAAGYLTVYFGSYHPTEASLYGSRIKKCLNLDADVTAQDARGSTPLHWAFRLQEHSLVRLLLDHHKQFVNPVSEDGLSHLHVACAAKNEFVVLKLVLLNRGDVINARVKSSYSWQSGYYRTVMKSGSTPLHFAVDCPKITEILLHCGADVLVADDDGFNPLERVLGGRLTRGTRLDNYGDYNEGKRKILQLLIRRLTETLADSTNGPEKLFCCYRLLQSNFFMSMLDEIPDEIFDKIGITNLHLACVRNDVDGARESLEQDVDVDARVHRQSPMWSGLTPLFCYLVGRQLRKDDSDDFSIAKLLLERGADVMKITGGVTAIYKAFNQLSSRQMPYRLEVPKKAHKKDLALVKLLLSRHKDFAVNPKTSSGLSHLHIACACNDVDSVEGFLNNGADVDQKIDYFCERYGGDTPLHFAAIYKSTKVVDLLLKHGADVRSTNNYDSTPLHVAAKTYSKDSNIFKALLNAGADANAENFIGATPMELLLTYTSFTKDEVDIFLKNGFHPHVINPVTREGCLALALRENQNFDFVYEMFVGSMDVKRLDKMNRNVIHNVVSLQRPKVNEINYGVVEEPFTPVEYYTRAIKKLMKMNVNIDQQDRQGKTPLHYAAQMQNLTAILALLINGADINLKDESGKTAFAYSVEFNEEDYSVIDERIVQIFLSHVYKLSLLNLDIDVSVKKLEKRFRKRHTISVLNVEECHKELAKLRKVRFKSCSISLKDFLCETSAIVFLSKLPPEERRVVDKLFGSVDYLSRKYPGFVGILILQFRKALERVKLIPLALVSLNVLMRFNVPLVCSDIILQFLSNDNLKNLMLAVNVK